MSENQESEKIDEDQDGMSVPTSGSEEAGDVLEDEPEPQEPPD